MLKVKSLLISILTLAIMFSYVSTSNGELILYLPLDGGDDNVVKDASSYENNGEITGDAKWVDGNKGNCIELVANSYVEIPEISVYDVTDEVSLMAWVNTNSVTTWARIIDKSQWQDNGFDLALSQITHVPLFEFFVNNTTSQALATTPVDDGQWHFIAGTFGNKILRIYVDGIMEKQVTATNDNDIKPNDWPIRLGCEANDAKGQQYVGLIDEVAIFNEELSEDEIQDIYQNGVSVSPVNFRGKLSVLWGELRKYF